VNKDCLESQKTSLSALKWMKCGAFIMIKNIKSGCGEMLSMKVARPLLFDLGQGNISSLINCRDCLNRLTQVMSIPMAIMRIMSVFTGSSDRYEEKHAKD
jgi:hypothetical protein